MIKKIFLIILIVTVAIILFFFDKKESTQSTVVFWTLQLNNFGAYMNTVIKNFEKENPDIKVHWIDVPYSEGEKRVLASLLSDNMPDLINITADFTKTLSDKKALALLDASDVRDYSPEIMKTLKNGENYTAFPFYATSAITFYNKELAEQGGITAIPTTFDELNKITPDFYKKTNKFAQMPTLCENDTFLKILNKYGINNANSFNSDLTQKLYEEYKYLYQNNFIPQESITQTHREVLEKYGAGQIAFLQAGSNFLNIIKENSPQVFNYTDVAPQLKTQNSGYDFSLMTLAIPLKAKNKDAAKKFAIYLLNEENQLEFAKLTAILPVNKYALENEYFAQADSQDIFAKARTISAAQLKNLQVPVSFKKNQKEIQNAINNSTQTILLDKTPIKETVEETSAIWQKMTE